jgi:hypothetical protein
MEKFTPYLKKHASVQQRLQLAGGDFDAFDYKKYLLDGGANHDWLKKLFTKFQAESVGFFFRDMRKGINDYAGYHVTLSFNYYINHQNTFTDYFDYGMRELGMKHANPRYMWKMMRETSQLGKAQVVTIPKSFRAGHTVDVSLCRKTIAAAYALGSAVMVPWDTYMNSTKEGSDRYYGSVEDFGDLYRFVRMNAGYFDNYEEAAAIHTTIDDPRYPDRKPLRFPVGDDHLFAVIRALPSQKDAPVVVHLINYADDPQPFTVQLDRERFFGDSVFTCTMLSLDGKKQQLNLKDNSILQIPTINPWAILVVEKK